MIWRSLIAAAAVAFASVGAAQQPARPGVMASQGAAQRDPGVPVSDSVVSRLIDEGMQRSHVDQDLSYLLDVIGPRLSGSPEMRRANEWTQQKFREYGVDRADLESWNFGRGWSRGPMTAAAMKPETPAERWIT